MDIDPREKMINLEERCSWHLSPFIPEAYAGRVAKGMAITWPKGPARLSACYLMVGPLRIALLHTAPVWHVLGGTTCEGSGFAGVLQE